MSDVKQKIRDMIKEEIKNFKSEEKPTKKKATEAKKPVKESAKKKITKTKAIIKEATSEKIDGILVVTTDKGTIELHLPMGMSGSELKKWLAKHPDIDEKWAKK